MKYASRGKLVAASVLAGLALGSVGPARAEFAAAVSPPRFELDAEPGKTIRKVIEITHVSPNEGSYRFQTMDWRFSPKGELSSSRISRRTAAALGWRSSGAPRPWLPAASCGIGSRSRRLKAPRRWSAASR